MRSIPQERTRGAPTVPPSEGDEARWEGRQEVGVARSTEEVGELTPGDPTEGRGGRVTELLEGKMPGTSSPTSVSTRLQQVAELARRMPQAALTTLAHHVDKEFLHEAYRRTRKDGAVGIDHQTAAAYAANLEVKLQSLLERFKSGSYFAPPVRRVYIPKGDGSKTRPIGIPTFEDKVLQRAVAMVLEAIYEQEFKDCSYGFRPGRSAHQALLALWKGLMDMGGGGGVGGRYPQVLRHSGSRSPTDVPRPAGTRRSAEAYDRQVAEVRGANEALPASAAPCSTHPRSRSEPRDLRSRMH